MRWMAMLAGVAIVVATLPGCGGGRHTAPEVRPGDFAVTLIAKAYPMPAPDIEIKIWGNGSGSYRILFKDPAPGQADGPFTVQIEQLNAIYAAVLASQFFKLDEEYIEDPPIPGRGVDIVVVSAGGYTHQVISEYAEVPSLDLVRTAVLEALPDSAYDGGSLKGAGQKYVGNKLTGVFHPANSPEAENIPEENRVPFDNPYQALDAGYNPAPAGNPFDR